MPRNKNEDKFDNSLEAFLETEEANNDEEGATTGTSQQLANIKESAIIELDQISSSATESDEKVKAQFVRETKNPRE